MDMTGVASLDSEVLRSRSLFIERLTDPKPEKGLLDVFGEDVEVVVAFLPGPNGKRERRVRKEGIPEPAGLAELVWLMLVEPGE
jgi:hypothetical protein